MSSANTSGRARSKLNRPNVQWIVAHGARIVDDIPRPGRAWRWSDTEIDSGTLSQMSYRGLIEHVDTDEQIWRTKRKTIEALAEYQGVPEDEVGVEVGQESFGGAPSSETSDTGSPRREPRGKTREDGVRQESLGSF